MITPSLSILWRFGELNCSLITGMHGPFSRFVVGWLVFGLLSHIKYSALSPGLMFTSFLYGRAFSIGMLAGL